MFCKPLQYFSVLFVAITLMRGLGLCNLYMNTFVEWGIAFVMFGIAFWFAKTANTFADSELRLCKVYLIWILICIVRGVLVADNYWEYKNLINGSLSLSMPLFVFYFKQPQCIFSALQKWNIWIPPLFFILLFWFIDSDSYHFLLTPFLFYGCFFAFLSNTWKVIVGIVLALMLYSDLGARAQVIKAFATILCAIAFYYRGFIKDYFLKIIHWLCYIGPVVLLILGVSGIFNLFKDSISEKNYDKYKKTLVVDGKVKQEQLAADTRTFIYEETLNSSLKNKYVILGRTPARGNDSYIFGAYTAEDLKTGKYERHKNELCHLNVFTWVGVIGLLLHCGIYLLASYRAVYFSKNQFVKYIGILVSFNWALGWIENTIDFNIMNLTIWFMISICLSKQFREMNDMQFEEWFRLLFYRRRLL